MYGIELQAQVAERQQTLKRWFTRALLHGWWHALWSMLWGKPGGLLDLTTLIAKRGVHTTRTRGCQTVPISRIRGSEGRYQDFDSAFHPRQAHTRDRWLHVARARLDGIELAPVELIQVGEDYFVRDGHHRISVATTFGQREIDAVVTMWEIDEPAVGAFASPRQGVRQLVKAGKWWDRSRTSNAGAGYPKPVSLSVEVRQRGIVKLSPELATFVIRTDSFLRHCEHRVS